MKAVLQRVASARVEIDGEVVGAIGLGLLLLLCAERSDVEDPSGAPLSTAAGEAIAERLLAKLLKLRLFSYADGKMNRSVQDVAGGLLVVSQFTLAADTARGNRPGFSQAAPPEPGRRLVDYFIDRARALHPLVATGRFGADMQVHLVNDGPVTILLQVS